MVDKIENNNSNNISIDYISSKLYITCLKNVNKFLYVGDNKGKISIYDIENKKPMKYINSGIEKRIE